VGFWLILAQREREIMIIATKSVQIFVLNYVKMSKLTFHVGIKRRKIDEYRTEALSDYHDHYPGPDRCGRADGRSALIFMRESHLPQSLPPPLLSIAQ
jgi:hypothetical protein